MSEENTMQRLLDKLQTEPLAKEREEFGRFLFRHIDSLSDEERKRYDELAKKLSDHEKTTHP